MNSLPQAAPLLHSSRVGRALFEPETEGKRLLRRQDARIPCWVGNSMIGKRRAELLDISIRGCLCASEFHASPGTRVLVTIAAFGPMLAAVRWTTPGRVGLEFVTPLHPGVVDHIVKAHPAPPRAVLPT